MSYPGQPQSPWPGGESHQPHRHDPPVDSDPWHGPGVVWGPAQAVARPPRGGGGRFGVVVGLVLLVGAGAGAYLMTRDVREKAAGQPSPASPDAPTPSVSVSVPNSDARTTHAGECLLNAGTGERPDMRRTGCARNTYEVLRRIDGTADKSKCDGTSGLTDWYFFDHPDDSQDFVLCLHKR